VSRAESPSRPGSPFPDGAGPRPLPSRPPPTGRGGCPPPGRGRPRVDAEDLLRRRRGYAPGGPPRLDGHREKVGQVELGGRVCRLETRKRGLQEAPVERVDAAFTSGISFSRSEASRSSTTATTISCVSRRTRPYPEGSGTTADRKTAGVSGEGVEHLEETPDGGRRDERRVPGRTTTRDASPTFGIAARSASPVPRGRAEAPRPRPARRSDVHGHRVVGLPVVTTTRRAAPPSVATARAVARTRSRSVRPAASWSTFGSADCIRVPDPPARTTTAVRAVTRPREQLREALVAPQGREVRVEAGLDPVLVRGGDRLLQALERWSTSPWRAWQQAAR